MDGSRIMDSSLYDFLFFYKLTNGKCIKTADAVNTVSLTV